MEETMTYREAAHRLRVRPHYITMLVKAGFLERIGAPEGVKGPQGHRLKWLVTRSSVEARARALQRQALARLAELEPEEVPDV